MNNGLAQMLYAVPPAQTQAPATVGTTLGLNVGSETLRVQLSIAGLLLAAVVGLFLLHRTGVRFHVNV